MKYTPRQITLDLAEFQELEAELALLRKPTTGEELTEVEHQEATGILLIRTLQNPDLIRRATAPVDLGRYKAIIIQMATDSINTLRVKFERS